MAHTRTWTTVLWGAGVMFIVALPAQAQPLSNRVDQVRRDRHALVGVTTEYAPPSIRERMRDIVGTVTMEDATLESAFRWWSDVTKIPLVVDWNALELEGINRDQRINLRLRSVPAGRLLGILMSQASPDVELLYETTPWYIQVLTKRKANQNLVVRVYHVEDLVMDIPNFAGPSFDLNDALSNTSSGGSSPGSRGGGQGRGIFEEEFQDEPRPSKTERGQALADTVKDTIEPTLWLEVQGASVSYFDGKLIVSAPRYIHKQIGLPAVGASRAYRGLGPTRRSVGVGDLDPIGGVSRPTPVADVEKR